MVKMKESPFFLSDEDIRWVEDIREGMSLEEKVGQLFCLHGDTTDQKELLHVLENYHPGGMMYRPSAKEAVYDAHYFLQKNSSIPMLLAANLESGGDGIGSEGTFFGRELQVAASGNIDQARNLGKIAGSEGYAVGCNWAFAPVVDIDFNCENPITNVRTFGSDTNRVKQMSAEYIKACQSCGIAACAKHFPGDGVDNRDQHLVTSVNSLSVEEWENTYGEVYREVIKDGVMTIMAGHIQQPAYTKFINPDITEEAIMPGSLSKELLQGLLREKLGFNGMIVTDATNMVGFSAMGRRRVLLAQAINAGCDMLLFTKNLDEDYHNVLTAVRNREISEERLNEAVTYILATKAALRLHEKKKDGRLIPDKEGLFILQNDVHKQMAYKLADESITLVKNEEDLLPILPEKYKRVLLIVLGDQMSASGKPPMGELFLKQLCSYGFQAEKFDDRVHGQLFYNGAVSEIKEKYDMVVYFANIKTASNQTTVRINWKPPMGYDAPWFVNEIPTIFISAANPYHLQDVPMIKTFINAYTANEYNMEMLLQKLTGKSDFKGTSPVDPYAWEKRGGVQHVS